MSNSTFGFVDLSKLSEDTVDNLPTIIYPGKTTILRFDLVIPEEGSYDFQLELTSTISEAGLTNILAVQNFFISDVGVNYPCVYGNLGSTELKMGSGLYPESAGLNVGDIEYMSLDPKNLTASTVFKYRI